MMFCTFFLSIREDYHSFVMFQAPYVKNSRHPLLEGGCPVPARSRTSTATRYSTHVSGRHASRQRALTNSGR
jgi:hypothetical protein